MFRCVMLCTPVHIYQNFNKYHASIHIEDGDSSFLQITGKYLPNYTALYPQNTKFHNLQGEKFKAHIFSLLPFFLKEGVYTYQIITVWSVS
jgi:hypothetical protein